MLNNWEISDKESQKGTHRCVHQTPWNIENHVMHKQNAAGEAVPSEWFNHGQV